jgi:bifunctional non-homologous end joining protein LigD
MALEVYRKKRNFQTTPEPRGAAVKGKANGLAFVIQKHAASHLHYDFRLELDGVLLSWAVPKGPSLDPADKRLAMHVEDHPIEYGDFEGVIPPKQYGSGTVLLWDRGIWIPREDPHAGYKKGKLKFELRGQKLHGGWTLVRSHGGKYGGEKSWLLIKESDEFAKPSGVLRIVDDKPASVASGRTLEEIAASPDRVWHSNKSVKENVRTGAVTRKTLQLDPAKVKGSVKTKIPEFPEPQLATLVKECPAGDEWVQEIKFDGYRMLCSIKNGEARMYSRNAKEWTHKFPAIARMLGRLPIESAWVDGEAVVLEADGRSSFQAMQNALSFDDPNAFVYYIFDLLYVDGYDLREAPLAERKRLLEQILTPQSGALRYSAHFDSAEGAFFREACRLHLEGVIAKRIDSTYAAGRSRNWLKVKCGTRQEMVIGGFTDPEGSRHGFGALLLGVYEKDGTFSYAGKVGTGFNDRGLTELRKKLDALVEDKPAFKNPPRGAEARRSHWVKPVLVAEVAFTGWTNDGALRHPSFQGLREDKKASEVFREMPANVNGGESDRPSYDDNAPSPSKTKARSVASRKGSAGNQASVAGIEISNPAKLLYPDAKLTKLDIAGYCEAVGTWLVPHLRQRPLTIVRCPNGWDKPCFYQKNDHGAGASIDRVDVRTSEGPARYMMANSVAAVVALLQMGVLELHPWGSSKPKLDFPDRIVFDFDPADDLPWPDVVQAVQLIKTLLDDIGLRGFLKTTGGKGLHVVIPIAPTLPWSAIKGFTKTIAELFTRTFPDRFTAKVSKGSRHGKIFIDYLRNDEGSTAIAAYSMRARSGAPVATPIEWTELAKDVRFGYFNVNNVPARLKRLKKDPWADFFTIEQSVTTAMMKRVGYMHS